MGPPSPPSPPSPGAERSSLDGALEALPPGMYSQPEPGNKVFFLLPSSFFLLPSTIKLKIVCRLTDFYPKT